MTRPPRGPDAAAGGDVDLSHHGDREVGAGLVDLAVNVMLPEPPEWLRARLAESLRDLAAYPDPEPARRAVAARHGRDPREVLLTAGAAEGFLLLARALAPAYPVVVHPQFSEPEAALRGAGHRVRRVLLGAPGGFALSPEAVPPGADLVVVGNPTNPTSVLHPARVLAGLAREGRVLVVDEAFMDAVPGEPETLARRGDLPGLVVLRSLTKTWGLAGLRVGYLLAPPRLVDRLAAAQQPWPVSTPALVAAAECSTAGAGAEAAGIAARVAAGRDYLRRRLEELPAVGMAAPPAGPFVLARVPDGGLVRERLRARGFAVRRGDTFPGLGRDWLRVAAREPATTDAFVRALRDAVPGG